MPERWRVVTRDPRCDHDEEEWYIADRLGQEMCIACLRQHYNLAHDWLTGAEDRRKAAQGGAL